MVGTELHWIVGPWPGKLAMAARPRGGEWVADEMEAWHAEGVDTVVSLLEAGEEQELNLKEERIEAEAHGMNFQSFPIPDRQVPSSPREFAATLQQIQRDLVTGKNVVLHCRQGVGRTGLVAACLLLLAGYKPVPAVALLSEARGVPVPETQDQRLWLDSYAERIAAA
jgi:protein-tyrosine phosphatase